MTEITNNLHTNWQPWNGKNLKQVEGARMIGIYEVQELETPKQTRKTRKWHFSLFKNAKFESLPFPNFCATSRKLRIQVD